MRASGLSIPSGPRSVVQHPDMSIVISAHHDLLPLWPPFLDSVRIEEFCQIQADYSLVQLAYDLHFGYLGQILVGILFGSIL